MLLKRADAAPALVLGAIASAVEFGRIKPTRNINKQNDNSGNSHPLAPAASSASPATA
jgi:hypothetical protein